MNSSELATYVIVAFTGGIIAGIIAHSKLGTTGSLVGYFIFGALFPLIGIVIALLVKRPALPPQPPGWYTDPWNPAGVRYYDGQAWTYHLGQREPA